MTPDTTPAHRVVLSDLVHGWSWCTAPAASPTPTQWHPIGRADTAASLVGDTASAPFSDDVDAWYRLVFDHPWPGDTSALTLDLAGLATDCRVWLNGEPLLHSQNMFLAHTLPLNTPLRAQANELLLHFEALSVALGHKRPRPAWRTPMVSHQQLRWVRTSLLGRMPGWSPPMPPVGPWRPVVLSRQAPDRPLHTHCRTQLQGPDGVLNVSCHFAGAPPSGWTVHVSGHGLRAQAVLAPTGPSTLTAQLTLPDVPRWWPHTHGDPALFEVALHPPHGAPPQPCGAVGFRHTEADQAGGGFGLRVNGTPVFCRGACWMPLNLATLRAERTDYRQALTQARDAGMNMLRVPGNTVYEDPVFFELCDELGILVWQDLMFANMDYPVDDPGFAASATAEVAQHAARWGAHPCVAVVCGNSEVAQQAAMWGAPKTRWHQAFFTEHLRAVVEPAVPGAVYWPSSAHGGAFPHQPNAGTSSYYGVGAYKRGLDDALASRVSFATECLAFANIPPASTLRRAPCGEVPQVHSAAWKSRVYRDLMAGWDFDDVREHYVERLLGLRPDELRATDPARHLTLGRAVGAEVMSRTMAAWRSADSACRGALVWYLRDLWAGAGCGLVDDQGVPKAVFHALARVQQPLLATWVDQGLNGLSLHLVNDTAQPQTGQVDVVLYTQGNTRVAACQVNAAVAPRQTWVWPLAEGLPGFVDVTWAHRFGPPAVELVVATWRSDQGQPLGQALYFDPKLMLAFQGEPGLAAQATQTGPGCIEVTVSTQAAAFGVHIEASPGWQAHDDFFHLPPGAQTTVRFSGQGHWHATVAALNARQRATATLT